MNNVADNSAPTIADAKVSFFGPTGNVAINQTTDAGFRLDVNGSTRVQGALIASGQNNNFGTTTLDSYAVFNSSTYNGGAPITVIANGTGYNVQRGHITMRSLTNTNRFTLGIHTTSGFQFIEAENILAINSSTLAIVAIGTATPNNSAQLQVDSTVRGFLPPRMTTTQKNAISSPATGLVVYDTTLSGIALYNGTNWQNVLVPNSNNNVLIGTTTDNGQGTLQNTGSAFLGGLQVGGLTFSTSTTATTSTIFYYFNGGSGQTLTLPSTVGISSYFLIKNAGTADLTISRSGSTDTIMAPNGTSTSTTISLAAGSQAILVSNGAYVWIQIV
jgi:hypothetical protein